MRQHLGQDFSKIYVIDLGGNVRKNPGKTSNVFDIKVGVSINLLVKNQKSKSEIFYVHVGDSLSKPEKLAFLENQKSVGNLNFQKLFPNDNHVWLTDGLKTDFGDFIALGSKEAKASKTEVKRVLFKNFSLGVNTGRDVWAYNFHQQRVAENMNRLINTYNDEVSRWLHRRDKRVKLDDFVVNDETQIKWSSRLKECLQRGEKALFETNKIRHSLYRPFCFQFLFFDRIVTHRQGQFPKIFPTVNTEHENQVICVAGAGDRKGFGCLVTNYHSIS
jgi:predicted helicase